MANGSNRVEKLPRFVWRLLKLPSRILYGLGLGRFQGRFVLLLTTTGRKSGKPRVTPLQYDQLDGDFYVGAARGVNADWFRNIQADPEVQVQVKDTPGLNAMNIDDFSSEAVKQALSGKPGRRAATIKRAFRYHQLPASAQVFAEQVLPEIRVIKQASLDISDERIVLSTKLDLAIAKAGIFALHLDGDLFQSVAFGKIAPGRMKHHEAQALPAGEDFFQIGVKLLEFGNKGLVVCLII